MNRNLVRILKLTLPIALGVFLVWYSYIITSEEERKQILRYIREADFFWVGISIFIGMLSHVSRAIRWNYLLEPLGYKPKIRNNVLIILMAYLTNLGIPRSGEILRATALATYEDVPFEKGFGTIVTERIVDLLMLMLIIFIALLAHTEIIFSFMEDKGISLTGTLVIAVGGIFGLGFLLMILRRSNSKLALKLKGFVKGLLDGLLSVFRMKRKISFILHTIFIWGAYVAMFWAIKYTVTETAALGLSELLVAFIAGAFAITTTNGGIGLYPIAVSKSLEIFGVNPVSGDAFGWIMWISQTLMVVVFGAISFLILPLWNRKP
ncbi:MAG: lysylphosphatidylglycerol synthase transmembrane domain-containing protein [Flavobacteriaceae bacterium]